MGKPVKTRDRCLEEEPEEVPKNLLPPLHTSDY
jgi:hypothetical protein